MLTIPTRSISSQRYAAEFGGMWRCVHPSEVLRRRPPVQYGQRAAAFIGQLVTTLPELGVLQLPRGFVVGAKGWIVSAEGHLLSEHSWHGSELSDHVPRNARIEVDRREGTVASITSEFASLNYGHFLLDAFGRAELLRASGLWADVDWFVVAAPSADAERFFDRIGIPAERRLRAVKGTAVSGDTLLAPSFPGVRREYAPWLAGFLQREVGSPANGSGRRLYIRRVASRRILNEAELRPLILEHGFEIYDPSAHDDPPADFAAADIVMGVHGAGLTDIAFCRPETRVLELMPSGHMEPYWYTIADSAGLDYRYLVVDTTTSKAPGAKAQSFDVHVDPAEFAAALNATVAG